MKQSVLPKSARIHIRRKKALIRRTTASSDEREEKIKNVYQKHITARRGSS